VTSGDHHWCIDSSALVKLVIEEPESAALRSFLDTAEATGASALVFAEVPRASLRHDPEAGDRTQVVLGSLTTIVGVDRQLLDVAAALPPASLRSLDAIHLAAAQRFGDRLQGMITYDDRLAGAASAHGMEVVSPGR
jgi:predicted nucleic acid-binding protein